MLESLTIFSKGGLILYQYLSDPSLMEKETGRAAPGFTSTALNQTLIKKFLMDPSNTKSFHISEGISFVWADDADKCIVALYPDILFEGPRQYLREWATSLVDQTMREYELYQQNATDDGGKIRPDPAPFDKTFRALLNQSKNQNHGTTTAGTSDSKSNTTLTDKNSKKPAKKGKEKRTWGDAKVTQEAMAELDMSKKEETSGDAAAEAEQRALAEARAAYLPTTDDLQQAETEQKQSSQKEPSWSSTAVGWFQQMTGNKVLEAADLEKPLKEMESFLTSKNVANEIAHELCQAVQGKLVGKKLNSLYRVQTAVQQALESTITKILHHDVDLLRNALAKRGDSLFSVSKKTPYVVAVVGINGVGKSTSLAKLAYYFSQNGCKPLLVAGDTFRSGAVEQLKVHADCLNLPVFSQGYSKDPSSVAKAAIEQATAQGNDVVLIDTAGRMQNNVPLMKALGKLATENRPDYVLLVAEALVGHDGLSQYRMFAQALGRRGIDGLIVTKFDTVSDKVGAALTLTHETGVPIVFCGTGQKYHHLRKLNAPDVVRTLFS
mmetsp:Transcript_9593/g.18501  ORF Transcript_9593/g.18501 Transcript_9593/m.18501 type:complete len:551 (-) Transcript_9593:215-1867(-)